MVTITIDGKQISVDENLSILEAAQEADVKIPTLCYLKDVNESYCYAGCRYRTPCYRC